MNCDPVNPAKNTSPKSLHVQQVFEPVSFVKSYHILTVLYVHVFSFQSVKVISHENRFFGFLLKKFSLNIYCIFAIYHSTLVQHKLFNLLK